MKCSWMFEQINSDLLEIFAHIFFHRNDFYYIKFYELSPWALWCNSIFHQKSISWIIHDNNN